MTIHFPIAILFPLLFVALWIVVCFAIALMSGWNELGRVYAAQQPFQGKTWSFENAQLRFGGYHNILTIGANEEGLYLTIFPLFRVGHPPLFIPWRDVSVQPGKYFWVRVYKFEFRQVPSVELRLREKLANNIQAAVGSAWPGDRSITGAAF